MLVSAVSGRVHQFHTLSDLRGTNQVAGCILFHCPSDLLCLRMTGSPSKTRSRWKISWGLRDSETFWCGQNGIIFPNLEFLWLTRGPISLPKRYLFGWGGTVVHFGSFWISITSSTILYARWYIYLSLFTFLISYIYTPSFLHIHMSTYLQIYLHIWSFCLHTSYLPTYIYVSRFRVPPPHPPCHGHGHNPSTPLPPVEWVGPGKGWGPSNSNQQEMQLVG